uniref:NopRA1 domain-containing protein n=1 Tax=Steinernema glaseri TaxID=37863 RepID=A0A1I8A8E7_9BILA
MENTSIAEIASTSTSSELDEQSLGTLFVRLIRGVNDSSLDRTQQFDLGSALARKVKGPNGCFDRCNLFFVQADVKKNTRAKKNSSDSSPPNGLQLKRTRDDKDKETVTLSMILESLTKVKDNIACCMIAWLYRQYTKQGSSKVRLRRARAFIRLKATITIAELLAPRLDGDDWKSAASKQDVINFLSEALMVTERDKFFSVRLNKVNFHAHIREKILSIEFMSTFPKLLSLIKKSINLTKFVNAMATDDFPPRFTKIIASLNAESLTEPGENLKLLQAYLKIGQSLFRTNTRQAEWLNAGAVETILTVFQAHVCKRSNANHFNVALEAAYCLQVLVESGTYICDIASTDSFRSDMARERLSSSLSLIGELLKDMSAEEHGTVALKTALTDIGMRLLPLENFPFDNVDSPVYEYQLPESLLQE